jgi:hypothetical protein
MVEERGKAGNEEQRELDRDQSLLDLEQAMGNREQRALDKRQRRLDSDDGDEARRSRRDDG